MNEILAGIAEEQRVTEGLSWREFLVPANRWRMFIVITLQIGMFRSFRLSPLTLTDDFY